MGRRQINRFQSPSLRGSGRFSRHGRRMAGVGGFNPLHCGAVVASGRPGKRTDLDVYVSIPFIAGQWSLPGTIRRTLVRTTMCFNPLHCGAVVASGRER